MADISDVNTHEIKDLYESLESLSCEPSGLHKPGTRTNVAQPVS